VASRSRGACQSSRSGARSSTDGSSFCGLFTRVEIGHMVIGSEGQLMGRSCGSVLLLNQRRMGFWVQ
jgi:hypothetical protein